MIYENYKLLVRSPDGRMYYVEPGERLGQGWEIAAAIVGIVATAIGTGVKVSQSVREKRALEALEKEKKKILQLQSQISSVEAGIAAEQKAIEARQEEKKKQQRNLLYGIGGAALLGTVLFVALK